MVKRYKSFIIKSDGGLISTYTGFPCEIGKTYVSNNFNSNPEYEDYYGENFSEGFYADDVQGILAEMHIDGSVFEVEVGGRDVCCLNPFKHRWETMSIVRKMSEQELRDLLKIEEPNVGYKLEESCFPIHPFLDVKRKEAKPTKEEISLLNEWIDFLFSIRDYRHECVQSSIRETAIDFFDGYYIWRNVNDNVWMFVGHSVHKTAGELFGSCSYDHMNILIRAYIATLFPNITKWKYKEVGGSYSIKNINRAFYCVGELWRSGLVPSWDGEGWVLLAGKNGKIVYKCKSR